MKMISLIAIGIMKLNMYLNLYVNEINFILFNYWLIIIVGYYNLITKKIFSFYFYFKGINLISDSVIHFQFTD
jgi:hypothetical protein